MHLDTSKSTFENQGKGTLHSGKSLLFIVVGSHMLCTLYLYARIRYEYVTHTLAYVMHTLLIRSHTLCIRCFYACIRYAFGDKRYTNAVRQTVVECSVLNTHKLCV